MLSAYVLIETEVCRVAHVAQAITKLDGVQRLRISPAPRCHRKLQAPSLDELGRLVVSQIQVLDGVTRTVTCTVRHRYPREASASVHTTLGASRIGGRGSGNVTSARVEQKNAYQCVD
jgi:DNA-binding Lrp family transcriptional regulator